MKLKFIGKAQLEFLKEGQYIEEGETPEQRISEIVEKVREYEPMYKWEGLADIVSEMIEKNYLSLSTPGFSNFGRKPKKGSNTIPLPASCNIITVGDSIASIALSNAEVKMLSKLGAGVGTNYTRVAEKGIRSLACQSPN
jgi:ribonucleotide reductase alpha subunit